MIRAGIGGWNFEPWHGAFFPEGTSAARALRYASRHVSSIEVNGTFYSTFKRPVFRKWFEEVPDDFVFSLKAHRLCTVRKVLADAKPSIDRFLESGVTELKGKLGPILWQFAESRPFDPGDCEAFLGLLPKEFDGLVLRHAVEVRHRSFMTPEFVHLAREHNIAIVFAHSTKYPAFPDVTADFVYCRLQETQDAVATGYPPAEIRRWVRAARAWEGGGVPEGMTQIAPAPATIAKKKRDVFVYFIAGAKVRNPAAAMEFLRLLKA